MLYVCYYVSLLLVHHSRQFCLPKNSKTRRAVTILFIFGQILSIRNFVHIFLLKYFYMHGIYLSTKGAASICRYYIFATGSPLFPSLSMNLNTSPPLTSALNQNISRKSVNPNIRILKI